MLLPEQQFGFSLLCPLSTDKPAEAEEREKSVRQCETSLVDRQNTTPRFPCRVYTSTINTFTIERLRREEAHLTMRNNSC